MAAIGIGCLGFDAAADSLPVLEARAMAEWRAGDLVKAAALRRRALDLAVRSFGPGSARAGEAMAALARTDVDRRHYLDAEPLLLIAADVLADAKPPSPVLPDVFAELAQVAVARGAPETGEHWAERAVAAATKSPQPGATAPLCAMAAVRAAQERFGDSEALLRQALARAGETRGDKTATARILSQLGTLYLRQQHYTEALPAFEEAASLDQQALAPAHPFVADDYYNLGLAFDGLKRAGEARAALGFAVRLLEKGPEKDSLRLAYAERELARVLRAAGKNEPADVAEQESKRLIDRIEDDESDREREV